MCFNSVTAYDEGGLRFEREEPVGVEPELGEDSSQLLHDLHPPPEQRRDVSSNSFGRAIDENLGASLERKCSCFI